MENLEPGSFASDAPPPRGAPPGRGRRPGGKPLRGGRWGPGFLVAAAFIGPGTVTTASVAGASFGAALLWALLFSTIATIVLQEMAVRLGVVTGSGLGEAIRRRWETGLGRWVAVGLVVAAVGFGNAAYQTGNLLGAGLGLSGLAGGSPRAWAIGVAGAAGLLLWTGSYRLVERGMTFLVAVMSVVFLATAAVVLPGLDGVLSGLFVPRVPLGAVLTVVALVGTTVVPYNLFLHASAVGERWGGEDDLPVARRDLVVSVALGGAVSMAVLVTAAGVGGDGDLGSAAEMARALEPLLGRWASGFFALGLFSAGMTSAVTAPMAAAYAVSGALGWERDLRSRRMRGVWGGVVLVGALLAALGVRPVPAILFAQAANGLLLPGVAVFLLVVVNDARWMGGRRNGVVANLVGGLVVLVAAGLGLRAILAALQGAGIL